MPARLSQGDGVLVLKLGGDSAEFKEQLARVKTLAGRRYEESYPGLGKVWEFMDTDERLLKAVHILEPELSAEVQARVQSARMASEDDLLTHLPDDAPVAVPWQSRLAGPQRAGVDRMADHPHHLLADDMGGGKTVQSISTVFEYDIRQGRAEAVGEGQQLVIAPNSVLRHWRKELGKWAGVAKDDVVIVEGDVNQRAEAMHTPAHWYLVNWEKLQEKLALMPLLLKPPHGAWQGIIADEAHRAKNRNTQQSKGLRKLRAELQLALTGTPVMNNPGELWALLNWLAPKQYTSYWQFFNTYAETYEGYKGKPVVIGVRNADALRFELSNKMIRRTKRQIHKDIPTPLDPKIYEVPMGIKQRKIYEETVKDFWLEIANEVKDEDPPDEGTVLAQLEEGNLDVLKLMIPNPAARTLRLRQVSTSAAVVNPDAEDASAKLDAVVKLITENPDRPFVVFGWFKPGIRLLQQRLERLGVDARTYTGDNDTTERAEIADAFQAGEFRVIILSIATGGVGIDLYRASDVVFFEEDWVPGINQQAVDRVDRKGQTERVQVHIFRSADSVDTGVIAPKLATKKLITQTIMGD